MNRSWDEYTDSEFQNVVATGCNWLKRYWKLDFHKVWFVVRKEKKLKNKDGKIDSATIRTP